MSSHRTARAYVATPENTPAFWQINNLWRVMATGVQTGNSFCLLDQVVTSGGGGGPCTHTHMQDEGLYVVSGHCTFHAGGQTMPGPAGTFVSVPRHTQHSFTVDAPDTHLLNFYLPAGFELLLIGISHPAEENAPPPPGVPMAPPRLVYQLARDYGQTAVLGMPFVDVAGKDNMATEPSPEAAVQPYGTHAAAAPAYWYSEGLWSILATGEQTGGSYCLLEQTLPCGPSAPPHLHEDMDEVFCVLDGAVAFLLGDRVENAGRGDLVFIPRGTVHGFRVGSTTARLLNLYTPAGFERIVTTLGQPAPAFTMPPPGWEPPPVPSERRVALMADLGMRRLAVTDPSE